MNIIFLDIDGVLNSDAWLASENKKTLEYPLDQFDPRTVKLLNRIIEKTEAKIVLSSTWRLNRSIEDIQEIFKKVGIIGEIVSVTPDLKNTQKHITRGNEILAWCIENEDLIGVSYKHYNSYAIIDDGNDFLLWQVNNFFRCDRYMGLTPSLCRNVIRHFDR